MFITFVPVSQLFSNLICGLMFRGISRKLHITLLYVLLDCLNVIIELIFEVIEGILFIVLIYLVRLCFT